MSAVQKYRTRRFHVAAAWCCVATVALSSNGCTRPFWRQNADHAAYHTVRQKTDDPRWPLENYTIDIDPSVADVRSV